MKLKNIQNKITIFCDGPNLDEIGLNFPVKINGYTFNPSLFKKNSASNYLDYSKMILDKCENAPVSLEVIADDENKMVEQAKKLATLKNNVYVKIPIVFTNGKSTLKVISQLIKNNIKLNITAIFTLDQIKKIIHIIKDTETILSIFVGRIYDAGHDGKKIMAEINRFVHQNSKCKTLWASTRMSYDIVKATQSQTDIITMQTDQIKKLDKFNKNLLDYSRETVQQFFEDARSSGYEF